MDVMVSDLMHYPFLGILMRYTEIVHAIPTTSFPLPLTPKQGGMREIRDEEGRGIGGSPHLHLVV